jgi:HTH-type transcriptional repressor of NAD biosynthesis genes
MTTGLIIGKFLPPHAGHLYLFAQAQARVQVLHIILFSKAHEPIPGALRLAWLRGLAPGATVWHVSQEGQVDFNDPAAWDFWTGAIRAVLPAAPDLVFTSEAYGDELARRLGARHICVDPGRSQVPVGGTQIRAEPRACWQYLPPAVRWYYLMTRFHQFERAPA